MIFIIIIFKKNLKFELSNEKNSPPDTWFVRLHISKIFLIIYIHKIPHISFRKQTNITRYMKSIELKIMNLRETRSRCLLEKDSWTIFGLSDGWENLIEYPNNEWKCWIRMGKDKWRGRKKKKEQNLRIRWEFLLKGCFSMSVFGYNFAGLGQLYHLNPQNKHKNLGKI
jgi:hypothetical protein